MQLPTYYVSLSMRTLGHPLRTNLEQLLASQKQLRHIHPEQLPQGSNTRHKRGELKGVGDVKPQDPALPVLSFPLPFVLHVC